MKHRIFFSSILLTLVCLSASARSDDFGIWTNIGIEKSLNKWSLNGELELRTQENSKEISRWGIKVGGDYSIIKGVKVGAAYQFLYFHDIKYWDFQPRHRFIGHLQGKKKIGRVTFTLRERFQMTTKDDSDRIKPSGKKDEYKMNPEWSWRNRLKIAYDIPKCKFTPSFSFETFFQLNNPDRNEFDGLRYTLSLVYKLDKKSSFEIYGVHDREVNVKNPVSKNVLGLGYTYSF